MSVFILSKITRKVSLSLIPSSQVMEKSAVILRVAVSVGVGINVLIPGWLRVSDIVGI